MPVYQLMEEMPYDELIKWTLFFKKRPVGWREDGRAFRIMQSFGTKAKIHEVFESYAQMKAAQDEATEEEQARRMNASLRNSAFMKFMMNAKGGEKLGD